MEPIGIQIIVGGYLVGIAEGEDSSGQRATKTCILFMNI